eukprot:4866303-Pyramimonas_sp.AAC.1
MAGVPSKRSVVHVHPNGVLTSCADASPGSVPALATMVPGCLFWQDSCSALRGATFLTATALR